MAYKDFDGLSLDSTHNSGTVLSGDGHTVDLPDVSYVRDAAILRDGMDLVLDGPDGKIIVKDYFADDSQPNLVAPDGSTLTPDLVNSFVQGSDQHAGNTTMNDASPVGAVQEVTGHATVTHPDGTSETIQQGTPIFQGDIVETDAQGAVNITFIDETSFAVSQDARLAIDEYVYDPGTESGATNFSVLKGVFVFTSGLIGRDDPDDVHIHTPVGSIGIRGTIIAGNVDTGEITVVEGAIVLSDHEGHEMTLASQFETARFQGPEGIENLGNLSAHDVSERFFVVSQVSPTLFSSINDAASEQQDGGKTDDAVVPATDEKPADDTSALPGDDHSQNTVPANATTDVAVSTVPSLPAVPPPVNMVTLSGFETPGGLHSALDTTTTSTLTTSAPATAANTIVTDIAFASTTTAATAPLPPPVNEPTLPLANAGNTTTTTALPPPNAAPVYHPEAPAEFFKAGESQTWHYRFDKEFTDDGGQTNLHYELSAQTIADLNAWVNDAGGPNPDILAAGGWTFNATTGELQLNFNTAFSTTPMTNTPLVVEVRAIDSQGLDTGFHDYDLRAYNGNPATAITGNYTTSNTTVSATNGSTFQLVATNSNLFLSDNNDTVTVNTGTNDYLNLGDGTNTVILQNGARDNTVVGGDGRDTVEFQNGAAKVYGMDGDDDFKLVLDGTSTLLGDLQTAGSGTVIDGGHSNFRAGQVLHDTYGLTTAHGEAGGRGDSLVLQGVGTLDFGLINPSNQITSIERIDAATSAQAQTIVLNYADVLAITDDRHSLVINLDGNDRLELNGMAGMTKVLDNVAIDDAPQGGGAQMRNYDVYTDGNVTILVSATGAAATAGVTIDGVATAV